MSKTLAGWCAVGLFALTACGGEESPRALDPDGGSTEKAVAEAWFTYLEEFVRVLGTPDQYGFRLSEIANGPALLDPLAHAGDLAKDDLRLGGGMIATLLEVEVTKGRAVVRGCIRSSMLKVDATDKPVVAMEDPWIDSEHRLVASGNEWFVEEHELGGGPKCV